MWCQVLECMKETCTCLLLHIRVIDAEFIKCWPVLTVAFLLVACHMKFLELWKSADHFADFLGSPKNWFLQMSTDICIFLWFLTSLRGWHWTSLGSLSESQTGLRYCNTRQSSLIFCHAYGRFVLRCELTCSKGLLDGEWTSVMSNVRTC